MGIKKIVITMVLLLTAAVVYAEQPEVKGVFQKVTGKDFHFDGKEVEITEFLSFYCGHCYHFEQSIPVIKGNFPKKIKWKVIPIYWGNGSPKPGEAYLIALDEGKGEEMKKALFHAIFEEKRDIGNIDVLEDIGVKAGLGFEFSRRLRAGDKSREVGEAILKTQTYDIKETPTLIIAGNLEVSPSMFHGDVNAMGENVIMMLKSLFNK